jgi:hypothetical protein
MAPEKHLLTAAITAACLTVSGVALAAQPANIEDIRCSNNGGGNGGETNVTAGDPPPGPGGCLKFQDIPEDEEGPGEDPLDPNPKN